MSTVIQEAERLAAQLESNADAHQEAPGTERRRAAATIRELLALERQDSKVLEAFASDASAREARLRDIIQDAPHGNDCDTRWAFSGKEHLVSCNCWKAQA